METFTDMEIFANYLLEMNEGDVKIRDAIIEKGVDVPDATLFVDLGDKIAQIEGGGEVSGDSWIRPTDRPALPFGTEVPENEMYILFGVTPTGPNDFALNIFTQYYIDHLVSDLTVDLGDGNVTTSAAIRHIYDYDSLLVTPNNDGVKWVWIKAVAKLSDITQIATNVRHNSRPTESSTNIFVPQVYEIYLNAPQVWVWTWAATAYTRYRQLEIFDWQGENKLSGLNYFLAHSNNLKQFNMYTGNSTSFNYFLLSCHSFNQPLNIDTSKGTTFNFFMSECYSFNQPLNIDTSKGITFTSFMNSCYSFNQPVDLNTSNGTNFNAFLTRCYSLNQPVDIDTSKSTNSGAFMAYCYTFSYPIDIDTSKNTLFTYFMYQCYAYKFSLIVDLSSAISDFGNYFIGNANHALTSLRLLNMGSGPPVLTISNSSLGVTELVALFGDLYDRTGLSAGTITITGCFGAAALTEDQVNIAKLKNWGVTGAPAF